MTIEQNYALQELSFEDCTKVHGGAVPTDGSTGMADLTSFVCTEPKQPIKPGVDHTINHCIPAFSAAWRS